MLRRANSLSAGKFSFIFWLSDLGRNIVAKKKGLRVAGRGNVVHVAITIIASSSHNQAPTMCDVVYRDTIWYELSAEIPSKTTRSLLFKARHIACDSVPQDEGG
jgi:hypothetical protein